MILISSLSYVFSWVVFLLMVSAAFFSLFVFHLVSGQSLALSLILFPLQFSSFSVVLTSDIFSSLFSFTVCFISSVVFSFSYYYFSSSVKFKYFSWVTFLFVLSMLVLINFSDIFFVMLGWDGLGVVSFFLIIFYQSPVSIFSSIFTVLMNRLGDCFFVVLIVLYFFSFFSSSFMFFDYSAEPFLAVLMILTFSTKSALFPFSPWLPAAMAAPTPISSLVHSSTLVTAGLFLIIRSFNYISAFSDILSVLVLLGLFTSFYAGLSSLVEADLKKVVALSTLSHLGFICLALGLGLPSLAFFHLLAHALFKSSLFISLGALISQHYHYQESRYFSSVAVYSPLFSSVMVISCASLMGLPFLSGFYSKDLILEAFSYSNLGSFAAFVLYINLFFTYSYSFRVLSALSSSSFMSSYSLSMLPNMMFESLLSVLSAMSVPFMVLASKTLYSASQYAVLELKFFPMVLLFAVGVFNVFYLSCVEHSYYSAAPAHSRFIFNMANLTPLWGSLVPSSFLLSASKLNRVLEYGSLHFLYVSYLHSWLAPWSQATLALYLRYLSFTKVSLVLVPLVFLLFPVLYLM